jgi:hypothetical protein
LKTKKNLKREKKILKDFTEKTDSINEGIKDTEDNYREDGIRRLQLIITGGIRQKTRDR